MNRNRLGTLPMAIVAFSGLVLVTAAPAQQIPDRATLNGLLGANKIEDDFQSYVIGDSSAENLDTGILDNTTISNGQGPGLVNFGAVYSDPSGGNIQWNGHNYYSIQTRTILANGSTGTIDIKYTADCTAMGIDLRAFLGYGYSGTVDIYDLTGTVVGSVRVSLNAGGAENVFVGWKHDDGISRVSIHSSTYSWSPVIDNHAYGTTGLSLSVNGDCPGRMTVAVSGATPNGWVGFGYGFAPGQTRVPGCPGVSIDINRAKEAGRARADANGDASIQGNVPSGACGRVIVQAVDLDTCETSNLVSI